VAGWSVRSMSQRPRLRAGFWSTVVALLALICVEAWPAFAQADLDAERLHALDRIRSAPLQADGFAELSAVLFRHGDTARAAAAAEEAARLEPATARYHRLVGYLRAANGNAPEAEAALRRATELEPTTRASLADFYLAQAWAEYQDALRRGPTDSAVAERLREIAALADLAPELQLFMHSTTAESGMTAELVPPIVLSEDAPYALVVEKKSQTARLYGRSGADEVELVQTFPCTTGQAAGTKSRRGDRRTPDGAYVVTDLLPGDQLADAYGALALPLSYPNGWDRRQHRAGNGIWLHGSDRLGAPFTPRETRGCVLLRNDDLRMLAHVVTPAVTPVLIAEEVPYRPAAEWRAFARELLAHAAAEPALAAVRTSDYAVVIHRDGAVIVRDFVEPDSPWRLIASEHSQLPAPAVWRQKLADLAPDTTAAVLSVRVLDTPAVVIETTAPVSARGFRPELGDRLYVDLPGVRQGPLPLVVPGTGQWVKEVRVAMAALDPPTTRLMIRLQQPTGYRIDSEGNRIVVSLGVE